MRFTVRCRQCDSFSHTVDTPEAAAEWLTRGHTELHPDHRRFEMYCDYKPLYEEVQAGELNFGLGDEYIFITRAGRDGKILAYGPDGRIAFFDRLKPMTHELTEGLRVRAAIIRIGDRWMIVEPIEIAGMASPLDAGMPELVRRSTLRASP
jgi:hypothetical protein